MKPPSGGSFSTRSLIRRANTTSRNCVRSRTGGLDMNYNRCPALRRSRPSAASSVSISSNSMPINCPVIKFHAIKWSKRGRARHRRLRERRQTGGQGEATIAGRLRAGVERAVREHGARRREADDRPAGSVLHHLFADVLQHQVGGLHTDRPALAAVLGGGRYV